MAIEIATLNNMIREAIDPRVQKVVSFPRIFMDRIVSNMSGIELIGQTYRTKVAVKSGLGARGGMRGAGGSLPTEGSPTYNRDMYIDLTRFYSRAEFDGPVLKLPNNEQIINTVNDCIQDALDAIPSIMESVYMGVNTSAIAKVASSANDGSTTTVTLDSDYLWPGTRRMWTGMYVDILSAITGIGATERCGSKQVTVASDTTFTISESSTTVADGDYVFFDDSSGTSIDVAPMGIAAIVDGPDSYHSNYYIDDKESITATKTVQGINTSSASYAYCRAQVLGSTSQADRYLDRELIARAALLVYTGRKKAVDSNWMLMSSPETQLGYGMRLAREGIRWFDARKEVDGVPAVDEVINGSKVEWLAPYTCGRGVLYGLHKPSLVHKQLAGVHPIGNGQFKQVEGYDKLRKDYAAYAQLGFLDRGLHFVVRHLTEM